MSTSPREPVRLREIGRLEIKTDIRRQHSVLRRLPQQHRLAGRCIFLLAGVAFLAPPLLLLLLGLARFFRHLELRLGRNHLLQLLCVVLSRYARQPKEQPDPGAVGP